jgi:hypothetical protein
VEEEAALEPELTDELFVGQLWLKCRLFFHRLNDFNGFRFSLPLFGRNLGGGSG